MFFILIFTMNKYIFYYLPFSLFIITQIILFIYLDKERLQVPQFVGHTLDELAEINIEQCPFRIYKIASNDQYQDNYIISQYPLAGSLIKTHQIVNIEVNKTTIKKENIPSFKKNLFKNFLSYAKKNNILYKKILFDYTADKTEEKVVAHFFDKKEKINAVYTIMPTNNNYYHIPNFYDQNCHNAREANSEYTFTCYCDSNTFQEREKKECFLKIKKQHPAPGIHFLEKNKIKVYFWH